MEAAGREGAAEGAAQDARSRPRAPGVNRSPDVQFHILIRTPLLCAGDGAGMASVWSFPIWSAPPCQWAGTEEQSFLGHKILLCFLSPPFLQ